MLNRSFLPPFPQSMQTSGLQPSSYAGGGQQPALHFGFPRPFMVAQPLFTPGYFAPLPPLAPQLHPTRKRGSTAPKKCSKCHQPLKGSSEIGIIHSTRLQPGPGFCTQNGTRLIQPEPAESPSDGAEGEEGEEA